MRRMEEYGPTASRKLHVWRASEHWAYLDLQQVIAADTLVVHLMVGIICVATALVLDKRKAVEISTYSPRRLRQHLQSARSRAWSRDVAADEASIPFRVR
jgi:hypothetical protein